MLTFFHRLVELLVRVVSFLEQVLLDLTRLSHPSIGFSTAIDFTRRKADLIAENAWLRQQLIVLHHQVKKPHFSPSARLWLVLLARRGKNWKHALLILKPHTLLRWHRQGFRLFWKLKSCKYGGGPTLAAATICLIQQMAKENSLWGAERIRGELLKLDIKVATATIRKYIRLVRPPCSPSQTWSVFLNNHAKDAWACAFLPVFDLFFRQTYLFFIVKLASRRILHFNVTADPTDAWVAQQLREATPYEQTPRFLIRDRDSKYGDAFKRVAKGGSKFCRHRIAHQKPTRSANASWAACGGNALITY